VVASKCPQNHFISEKYKKVPSLKLHFLQNGPIAKLNTSASHWKSFRESLFSSCVAFLITTVAPQERRPLKPYFSRRNM